MRGKQLSITLLTVIFLACSGKPEPVVNDSSLGKPKSDVSVVTAKNNYTCEECVELMDKIVRSSDYDAYFKKNYKMGYSVLINEATKDKVTIQIVIENDVPMVWLELKINEETLNDITNDPEDPKNINGDIQMMRDFRKRCLQCCLD